jgi:uncharacterized membrane protein YtjA (UPF0391 family)
VFKCAVTFRIVLLIAGAFGLMNLSQVAKRVSMVLFAMFCLVFLRSGALPIRPAIDRPALAPAATAFA